MGFIPKPHLMLMTSAKLLRRNCQLFYFCDLGGLYVNKYCSDFIIRFADRLDFFKTQIAESAGDGYCGNCTKPSCIEFD